MAEEDVGTDLEENADSNTETEDAIGEDDWAAAMQEQAVADEALAAQPAAAAQTAVFQNFDGGVKPGNMNDYELILDIPVHLTVELGRTRISIRNLLQLAHGSVVELDALAGEPMDVLVNGTLIAQGEVVVVNDKFGIRLTDIITPSERVRKLRN
jgi:flagellar motor switch protein FliN